MISADILQSYETFVQSSLRDTVSIQAAVKKNFEANIDILQSNVPKYYTTIIINVTNVVITPIQQRN